MIDTYKLGMNFNLEALEHASWTAGAILLLVWCDLFQWFLILLRVIFGEVTAPAPAEEACQMFFWRSCFSVNRRGAGAVLEEPLKRSCAKHPLSLLFRLVAAGRLA